MFCCLSNQHHQLKVNCLNVLKINTSEVKIKIKSEQTVKQKLPTQSLQAIYTKMEYPLL